MLGARGAQQLGALPVEEHDGTEVDVKLHVDVLGLLFVDRSADPYTSIVDEHVKSAEGLTVAGHNGVCCLLVRHVGRDVLDLRPLRAQAFADCSSRSGLRAVIVTP